METSATTRSKAVRRLLGVILAVALMLALLPLWFPWVLKPLLNQFGLGFAQYDRVGYTQFALGGVKGRWEHTRLEANRVECVLPTAWLWRRVLNGANDPPYLSVKDGHLTIAQPTTETQETGTARKNGSLNETLDQVIRVGRTLKRILPVAELTNCTVQVASTSVILTHADWRSGRLQATVIPPESRGEIALAGWTRESASLQLRAKWGAYDSSMRGEFSRRAAGWLWEGEVSWLANRADVSAQFTTNGWWPAKARLNCPEVSVPARLVRLPGCKDLNAALEVNLSSNQFNLQATGFARPSEALSARGFTAADFSLAAEGDPKSVSLREFDIRLPWLNVELTGPVGVTWKGELLTDPARLWFAVDLAKVPGTSLTGQASGEVRLEPQGRQPPAAQFSCAATNVRAWGVEAETIRFRGQAASPELRLDEFRADFMDGSTLAASGSFDFRRQQITKARWNFSGTYFKTLVPGLRYDELTATGQLSGPLTNVSHRGEVAIKGLQNLRLKTLNADGKWSGRNLQLDSVDVDLTAGESTLSIGGAVDLTALGQHKTSATLTHLSLRRGAEGLYALQGPCAISLISGGTSAGSGDWELAINALDWKGASRAVALTADLSWPSRGTVTAATTNFRFRDFSDFLTNEVPDVSLAALDLAAHWSNGPVHSAISVVGAFTNQTGESLAMRGTLATAEALAINQLSLHYGSTPALSVTGNVPVNVVFERDGGWLVWNKSRAIALTGNWVDDRVEQLRVPFATNGELKVSRPELRIEVSGTPEEPSASLELGAASVGWQSVTNNSPSPKLEGLHLRAEIHPDRITLDTFGAKLDGQPIQAAGEWPLPAGAWKRLWSERKPPDWSRAHGRLELEGAQVAAVARYLPQVLASEGQVSARLELKSGKQLGGTLLLTNAATRSLATLTPLRDITAQVRFDGQRAVLESFRGQIGGQPVRAGGFVRLRGGEGLDYQVNVTGSNVPLARSLEFLLRGDFDLRLRGSSNLPPVLSGGVNLRDGLFIQHASALVWSGPRRPELRPPYFSVTNPPLADWKLDLAVSGDRFLRVRTPVFSGLLSADLKLKGPLRTPHLTGDVQVNSGRVLFPFGALNVDQGYASFSGEDPQGPDVQITALGRNYGYDLRLEVQGPANVANVTFSSTPPLTSEQILLLLTAGELPQTDFAFSSGARVGRLATFLGKDLLSRFLGSGQGEERLVLRTGESISEEGRLTYSVEYRLTDRWSIIGEYDEFNAFNADLKWRILAR